jgi:hypothetical protein
LAVHNSTSGFYGASAAGIHVISHEALSTETRVAAKVAVGVKGSAGRASEAICSIVFGGTDVASGASRKGRSALSAVSH